MQVLDQELLLHVFMMHHHSLQPMCFPFLPLLYQAKTAKVWKHRNMRSCIKSNFRNVGLHPKDIVCYPAPGCHLISPSQPRAYSHKGCTLASLLSTLYFVFLFLKYNITLQCTFPGTYQQINQIVLPFWILLYHY